MFPEKSIEEHNRQADEACERAIAELSTLASLPIHQKKTVTQSEPEPERPLRERTIKVIVYYDAVRAQVDDKSLGWFKDEVCALGAAFEVVLMQSSMMAWRRKLPPVTICSEFRTCYIRAKVQKYTRATRVKHEPEGRRVVRVPGTFNRPWMKEPF